MMQHPEATEDEAGREVVAESMTDILPQSQFIQKLAQKEPGLFKKLLARLKAFIKDIKDHFARMGDTASPEVAAVRGEIDGVMRYAEKIVEAFDRVAIGAVENYQKGASAQKNTAGGGVQYQAKHERVAPHQQPITMEDIAILRSIDRKSINQFTAEDLKKAEKWAYKFYKELGVKSPFFRAWFGDWRSKSISPAEIVNFAYGENGKIDYGKRIVKNRDMNERQIIVDGSAVATSITFSEKDNKTKGTTEKIHTHVAIIL